MSTPALFSLTEFRKTRQNFLIGLRNSGGFDRPPPGWSKDPADPGKMLDLYPRLRLRAGYVLRAYRYFWGNGGYSQVWAMPADAPFPEPGDTPPPSVPPRPPRALGDVADALEGDSSDWSYVCASFLVRDLRSFGERWHNCDWSKRTLLDDDPDKLLRRDPWSQPSRDPRAPPVGWTCAEPKPVEWRPSVLRNGLAVGVTFYTYCGRMREGIYHHEDTYSGPGYAFTSREKKIAEGMDGYVA